MPEIKSPKEYFTHLSEDKVIDMKNPFCINCNECCSMTAQLSKNEYEYLSEYILTDEGKKIHRQGLNRIKRYRRKNVIYMMCPFTDETTKKCRIYEKRPQICRAFHCNHSKSFAQERALEEAYLIADLFFKREK